MKNPTKSELSSPKYKDFRSLQGFVNLPVDPPGLRVRLQDRYLDGMFRIVAKNIETDIDLRKTVLVRLVFVARFSVLLTASVIIRAFKLIVMAPEVMHVLLASTIAQAVVLHRRVVDSLFHFETTVPITA